MALGDAVPAPRGCQPVSQPELRAELLEDGDMDMPSTPLTEEERFLLRHLTGAAALLIGQPDLYRELLVRRREEGATEELRAIARDAAEQAATVLQSARRRQYLIIAAQETPLNPSAALTALDQLFFSFTLLTGPDDVFAQVALTEEELDLLLTSLDVGTWLEELGVGGQ